MHLHHTQEFPQDNLPVDLSLPSQSPAGFGVAKNPANIPVPTHPGCTFALAASPTYYNIFKYIYIYIQNIFSEYIYIYSTSIQNVGCSAFPSLSGRFPS